MWSFLKIVKVIFGFPDIDSPLIRKIVEIGYLFKKSSPQLTVPNNRSNKSGNPGKNDEKYENLRFFNFQKKKKRLPTYEFFKFFFHIIKFYLTLLMAHMKCNGAPAILANLCF